MPKRGDDIEIGDKAPELGDQMVELSISRVLAQQRVIASLLSFVAFAMTVFPLSQ